MDFSLFDLFWVFLIVSSLLPVLQKRLLDAKRHRVMQQLEKKRDSRLITLIHRQEVLSFLGIGFRRYIDIEDSEALLRAIRLTPEDMPIDIILHTPGGLVLAAEQIAQALVRHQAPVTVFIPHYAMSGGTLIALAADEIAMDENAVLGPVDPQLGRYPASSILSVTQIKDVNETDDETLILADMAKKAVFQVRRTVVEILTGNDMEKERAEEIAEALSSGRWTHDYPISAAEAEKMGLRITLDLPDEVCQLMQLYPQSGQRRPSVQYIPVPYRREDQPPGKGE
jgi:ClpP class serine protease